VLVDSLGVTTEGRAVIRDVTFGLRFGERCALIGRNGSGKTTLLRAVAGDIAPSTGRVRLGAGVRVGLLEQAQAVPDSAINAIEVLRPLVVMEES
jgi:ATPase subunit of ABC transporter with duplicated ATPase domains